ncbi:MAG TPA: dihydroorotate dehydrogenase-like protein [Anaerolineaceae bacterium]|nr:dihydroorotate dehydrogenase-like protein [Anaerolineaceae bacterium]HPN52798.1 dihydroorotate dehydrogenase-like protein [Anaerolineaceae bacterium]
MADLSTSYLGLFLKNPVVAAASPLSKSLDGLRRLEDGGVSAVVLYSLFEEQITHESNALNHFLTYGTDSFAEALSYFPDLGKYNIGPEAYLELIQKGHETLKIPIIGSLNGISAGGWVDYAKKIQEAGADALELNMYYVPTDINLNAGELEKTYVELVREVTGRVSIPVAVKLSPYFSALPNFARRLVDAGASGLVMFNRFVQPDLDIETLDIKPAMALSTSSELLLPLRWTAILYRRLNADLAVTGGVHTAPDVVKAVMAGAAVTQLASELISGGAGRAGAIAAELSDWMDRFEYKSIQQMRGSMSQKAVAEPAAYERANYMRALTSYDNRH